ncbi:PepSY-associated TM helix domain-containing protein [Parasphingorhabdus sp.]|uniref:PepSY-associated TM helix domain-containing protein n=1 Tax=Parasphingorhabdus sp. TaxID=2709688 RepID=UPI003264D784
MMDDAQKTDQEPLAKRALAAHHLLGIAISAVLYIICFSGMISVFKEEIQLWEQSGDQTVSSLSPEATQVAAQNGMKADPTTAHVFIHMPTDQNQRAIVETDNKETYVDKDGNLGPEASRPWTDFLIDLHYYLHLPHSFGMIVVAIFGVFLFAMSVTGLVAHPNIFKDAFAFRRSKSEQIKQVDLHNRLAVWTAPFHISNSLTGAMIGLAVLSAAAVGTLKYDGDADVVFEPVFGAEPAVDSAPAPLANIAKALDYVNSKHGDTVPLYVILHDPETRGQYLQIMSEHPRRLIYAEKYNFNGNGDFIDTVGSADGHIGQQVADSVYKVHFGQFGGLPVKLAFGLFGIALLYIIHAGMRIYFIKRAAKGYAAAKMQRGWMAIVYGVPAMLLATLLLSIAMPSVAGSLVPIFWGGLVVILLGSLFWPDRTAHDS